MAHRGLDGAYGDLKERRQKVSTHEKRKRKRGGEAMMKLAPVSDIAQCRKRGRGGTNIGVWRILKSVVSALQEGRACERERERKGKEGKRVGFVFFFFLPCTLSPSLFPLSPLLSSIVCQATSLFMSLGECAGGREREREQKEKERFGSESSVVPTASLEEEC